MSSHEKVIDLHNLGNMIRTYRKKRGLTQKEVADRIGVTMQHYSRLERGQYLPGLETFFKLSEILDLNLLNLKQIKENRVSATIYEILDIVERLNNSQQKAVLSFLKTMNPIIGT